MSSVCFTAISSMKKRQIFVPTEEEFEAFNQIYIQAKSEDAAQLEGETSVMHNSDLQQIP